MSALSRKASEFQISCMVIVRYQMSIKWALFKHFNANLRYQTTLQAFRL